MNTLQITDAHRALALDVLNTQRAGVPLEVAARLLAEHDAARDEEYMRGARILADSATVWKERADAANGRLRWAIDHTEKFAEVVDELVWTPDVTKNIAIYEAAIDAAMKGSK